MSLSDWLRFYFAFHLITNNHSPITQNLCQTCPERSRRIGFVFYSVFCLLYSVFYILPLRLASFFQIGWQRLNVVKSMVGLYAVNHPLRDKGVTQWLKI
jgi:hypothetical protein